MRLNSSMNETDRHEGRSILSRTWFWQYERKGSSCYGEYASAMKTTLHRSADHLLPLLEAKESPDESTRQVLTVHAHQRIDSKFNAAWQRNCSIVRRGFAPRKHTVTSLEKLLVQNRLIHHNGVIQCQTHLPAAPPVRQLHSCLHQHSLSSSTSQTMPQLERSAVLGPVAPPQSIIVGGHTVIAEGASKSLIPAARVQQDKSDTESRRPCGPRSTPEPSLESASSASSVQTTFSPSDWEETNSMESCLSASASVLPHSERTHQADTSPSTTALLNVSNRPASKSSRKVAPNMWHEYDRAHDDWYYYNQTTGVTSWVSPPHMRAAR